ncbi:MAG: retropepsin-like domain-containing protein [Deltaproteobacteria bacterium]|nr:retropepsin-like domain-containing protein [Deltaproteobacteria bacterium]
MSLIEFPYTFHKGYLMPIIPITILGHRVWVFVDSGATFTILSTDDALRMGIEWERGSQQMIVVGDGSFIPAYFHDLSIQIDQWQITAPVGFSERLGVGFNFLGRKGIFDQFQICFNDHARKVTFQKL